MVGTSANLIIFLHLFGNYGRHSVVGTLIILINLVWWAGLYWLHFRYHALILRFLSYTEQTLCAQLRVLR